MFTFQSDLSLASVTIAPVLISSKMEDLGKGEGYNALD